MQNFHTLEVRYICPTNFRGSRVKITSYRFKESLTIPFNYELNDIADMAIKHLEGLGFHFVGVGESMNGRAILISDTFEPLKKVKAVPLTLSYKKYKCSECGHVKEIQTNHYGECYGQAILKMNMCPNCSWKHPNTNIVWTCQETPKN